MKVRFATLLISLKLHPTSEYIYNRKHDGTYAKSVFSCSMPTITIVVHDQQEQ